MQIYIYIIILVPSVFYQVYKCCLRGILVFLLVEVLSVNYISLHIGSPT